MIPSLHEPLLADWFIHNRSYTQCVHDRATLTSRLIRRPEQENVVARRRFQRGYVFINAARTTWMGVYAEYRLDSNGVEKRYQKKISLCTLERKDGSKVGKHEAEHLLQPYVNEQNARIGSPKAEVKNVAFSEFADTWKDHYLSVKKPATQASVKSVLKRLKTEFGQKAMREITPADLQRLVSGMNSDGLNLKTIRNVWGVISLVWKAALKMGYVAAVLPRPDIPRRTSKPKPVFFLLEEVAKIISAGEPTVFYWLLAETGIRAGELAGLKLSDVKGNCLNVNQSVWNGKEQSLKTVNSERTLVMSQQLQEMVWQQLVKQKEKGHDFLFSSESGAPIDMNNFRQRKLKPLLEKLKIPQRGFHTFRHFNVSILIALGMTAPVVEQRIGHALSTSITATVYTHLLDDSGNAEAGRKLGLALQEAVNSAALTLPEQEKLPVSEPEALLLSV